MKSISFDNPYLLFIAIPILLLFLILPFFLAVKKDMRKTSTIISLTLHCIIVVVATLAVAGMAITTVMTETHVYVVCDVSYSANKNLDLIDDCIENIDEKLPPNSKVGIVCFGKDQTLLSEVGGERRSVKDATVDHSATDIAAALDYTATLFEDDVIKRIVLITDGKETSSNSNGALISSVENLHEKSIYLDALYVDSNISEDATELQISDVEFTSVAYLNRKSAVEFLLQSTYETRAMATLYCNSQKISEMAIDVTKGYNTFAFDLPTDVSGVFDYKIGISADGDESEYNNSMLFTQSVVGNIKILLLTSTKADVTAVTELYGENAEIDAYIYNDRQPYEVPCTIEALCKYDEIIISSVDVRNIVNATSFVEALDSAVSLFGKSLLTFGDVHLQNKGSDEADLRTLQQLLPVKYGNDDQDARLYAIVLDMSRSMFQAGKFQLMKESAIQIINLLAETSAITDGEGESGETKVTVVAFSGDVYVPITRMSLKSKDSIIEAINALEPMQGTSIGAALSEALADITGGNYRERHAILISDGLNFAFEKEDPVEVAKEMYQGGVLISAIQPIPPKTENGQMGVGELLLNRIADAGKGKYFAINSLAEVKSVISDEVADELTETIIEQVTPVDRVPEFEEDEVLDGVSFLNDINGFVYGNSKANATTVLTVDYVKKTGQVTTSPLYAYRKCGRGRVASLMTSLTGDWVSGWQGEAGQNFLRNILITNIPEERIDHPYAINIEFDGIESFFEMVPATVYVDSEASITITFPDGTQLERQLIFDSERYSYSFETPDLGKYGIKIIYSYSDKVFESEQFFNISYSPEYNSFEVFDPSALYTAVRNRGTVNEDEIPTLENNSKEIATYKVPLILPLLIIAISLYVIDIIVRKIKLDDIKSLFKKKRNGGRRV